MSLAILFGKVPRNFKHVSILGETRLQGKSGPSRSRAAKRFDHGTPQAARARSFSAFPHYKIHFLVNPK